MADFKQSREVNWTITVKNEGTEETTTYSVNGKRSVADCLREALALEEHPTITKKAGELTVRLDVDASDAITALKALQREARKATQALRELEAEVAKAKLEQLAELEHEQWAHWTRYMLDNLTEENIARWRRQIDTPYEELSEKEKESDRKWARKVLGVLGGE
jgi:hypothetical protein